MTRRMRWLLAAGLAAGGCGDGGPGRGVGDEPPATVPTGPGGALEQAALVVAAGQHVRSAAARVRSAGLAPAAADLARIVAADHAALDTLLRQAADSIPAAVVEPPAPSFATESAYLSWQAELDSLLLARLAEEPVAGLGDARLREILRQAAPTLAAHRQRALQLRDSLARPDTAARGG